MPFGFHGKHEETCYNLSHTKQNEELVHFKTKEIQARKKKQKAKNIVNKAWKIKLSPVFHCLNNHARQNDA